MLLPPRSVQYYNTPEACSHACKIIITINRKYIIRVYVKKPRKNRRFNNIYKRINSETARNLNGGGGDPALSRRIYWTGPLLWDTL